MHVKVKKSKDMGLSKQDIIDAQQPIAKDGYSNDLFDKYYGREKNPYANTERDRRNRKPMVGNIEPANWFVKLQIQKYKSTKNRDLKKKIKKWLDNWVK